MRQQLEWDRLAPRWPNSSASRFVSVGHIEWHVQRAGAGPPLILAHGTGAATHSWRHVFPHLTNHFDVIAFDLPGHGFTSGASDKDLSLGGMAQAIAALLDQLDVKPNYLVGHSAGAAILATAALKQRWTSTRLISLNGAWLPFTGLAEVLFPMAARLFCLAPRGPEFFTWRAKNIANVQRVIEGTGSTIDKEGLALYASLFRNSLHVRNTICMMAHWNLSWLSQSLDQLRMPCLLVVGSNDRAVPPETNFKIAQTLPNARVRLIRGVGHLMHEERPREILDIIRSETQQVDLAAHDISLTANSLGP